MNNIWYLYFFIVVIFEILAIWLLTEWSSKNKLYLIILGVLSYIIVAISFAFLMKSLSGSKLAIVNAIWQVVGLITVTLLGLIVFKDKLNVYQWVGFSLAMISLILLSVGEILKSKN